MVRGPELSPLFPPSRQHEPEPRQGPDGWLPESHAPGGGSLSVTGCVCGSGAPHSPGGRGAAI